jgi:hypothetical protein
VTAVLCAIADVCFASGLDVLRLCPTQLVMANARRGKSIMEALLVNRRVLGLLVLALSVAGCGDNQSPPRDQPTGTRTGVSGGMVAESEHYRVVSTVTSGDVNAASPAHRVRGSVIEGGAR